MKKIITVFTICLVVSANAMMPGNWQNIHHMAPVAQQNYVQPRQVYQFNQTYNLPMAFPILRFNTIQEDIQILRSMQNQNFYGQLRFAPITPQNMLNNQRVTPQPQANNVNNKVDQTVKIQNKPTKKKPKKADAKDKKNAPKSKAKKEKKPKSKTAKTSKRVKKLTQNNLQEMQKLTRKKVNDRIKEYIEEGQKHIDDETALFPIFPI